MKTVLLVDGNNLAYRNFYAQNLTSSTGQNTGMIYGFINSMLTAIRELQPDIVRIIWDPPGGSVYRKNLYKLYKANRESKGEEFHDEMDLLKQLLKALGVGQITKPGVETDDILGYLSTRYYTEHLVYNMTNDKDILQVMSELVTVYHPEKGVLQMDKDGKIPIKEQNKTIYLYPWQVSDYKALAGDPGDNYPGLLGFGITAAINFFERNKSVDDILNNTADLRNQRSQALSAIQSGSVMLPLWKQLATLNIDEGEVEVPDRPEREPDMVNALFDQLEFKQFKALGEALYKIGGKE